MEAAILSPPPLSILPRRWNIPGHDAPKRLNAVDHFGESIVRNLLDHLVGFLVAGR
jgi:hypothetical protein